MRRILPYPVLVAIALLTLTAAGLVAAMLLMPGTNPTQLWRAVDRIGADLGSLRPLQLGRAAVVFASGLGVGWLAATIWLGARMRRKSLLLVDPREPDMAFRDGVAHVSRHAPSPRGEADAIALILGAARDGQLSLWRRTATNATLRIAPTGLRSKRWQAQLDQWRRSRMMPSEQDFLLRRAEVTSLWPARHTLETRPTRIGIDLGG